MSDNSSSKELGLTTEDQGITAIPIRQNPETASAKYLSTIEKLTASVAQGTSQRSALNNYVEYSLKGGVPFDQITSSVKKAEAPFKLSQMWILQEQNNGSILVLDQQGKAVGSYEKGFLDVKLPSRLKINLLSDSRLSGFQAEHQPKINGLVLPAKTLAEIANPNLAVGNTEAKQEGWQNLEQRTRYFLRHEYSHLVWDQLDSISQQRIISIFTRPQNLALVRSFAAILISKKEYQRQEETDPNKPCMEFNFGGRIHRYSNELIINELLAHAALGEMMPYDEMTKIQRSVDRAENFGARSKAASHCITILNQQDPESYNFLVNSRLVQNKDFDKDQKYIAGAAKSLNANQPLSYRIL